MGQTRRRVVTGTVAIGVGAALAACGGGDTAQQPAAGKAPVTLEYYTGMNARQQENHQRLIVEPYQKLHPHVTVKIIPSEGDFFTKLRTLIVGGTPPEVTWFAYPEAFLGNLIKEVTPYVRRDRYNVDVFAKSGFEGTCVWKGKILGLPNQSGGNWPVMPYNRDIFSQAGVPEPPAKWGESKWDAAAWLDTLQRTTRRSPDGRILSYGINELGAGIASVNWSGFWKASWLSDDFKTVTCDSPAMIEAMEFLISLATRHRVMATGSALTEAFGSNNALNNFLDGKLAMLASAGAATGSVAQAVSERGLPLAFAPLPTFKVTSAGHAMDDNGLPVGGKHPDEAWNYIKWSADTPNWAISRGASPARADLFDAWAKELYPGIGTQVRLDVYRESLRHAGKLDNLFKLPTYREMRAEILNPAYNRMVTGQASVATTLREIKAPLQALVPKDLP